MASMYDKLTRGGSLSQEERTQFNDTIGSAPGKRFGDAVTNAVRQTPTEDYYAHTEPGVNGTDPIGSLGQDQRGDLAGAVVETLRGKGISPSQIAQQAGVTSTDPSRMNTGDIANVLQWTQQNHPDVIGQVAQQYQQDPRILHSLLGPQALQRAAQMVQSRGPQ